MHVSSEWNTKIISTEQDEYAKDVLKEFEYLWNSNYSLEYQEFIEEYSEEYIRNGIIRKQKEVAREKEITSIEEFQLQPNSMQVDFISNLQKIREAGETRALLISATGTGKTYSSLCSS